MRIFFFGVVYNLTKSRRKPKTLYQGNDTTFSWKWNSAFKNG